MEMYTGVLVQKLKKLLSLHSIYLKLSQENGISVPYFIIHDVLESMAGEFFENMICIVNSM
ncbi:hypothetical protein COD91_06915 [Bacillus cereus]|nr:hypothetical protein COD91_06915 [Bacillus cereus]